MARLTFTGGGARARGEGGLPIGELANALRYAEVVAFAALGLVCFRLWRREQGAADGWLALTFADLGGVVIVALALPQNIGHPLLPNDALSWAIKALLIVLLAFPYLLFRFADALEPMPRRRRAVAAALTIAVSAWTLALPRIPASSDHRRPWWLAALLVLALGQWCVLGISVGVQLWKAGRGQPTGVRRRMQFMAAGSLFLVLALVPGVSTSNNSTTSVSHLASEVIALTMAALFFLGFAPPAVVRALWRRREEAALLRAEMALMTAVSADDVARSILPPLAAMFATRRAALVTAEGEELGVHGVTRTELERWTSSLGAQSGADRADRADRFDGADRFGADRFGRADRADRVDGPVTLQPGVVALRLRHGWVIIEVGVYTSLFGQEEIALLHTLGAFIDLALERVELFARERDTREALERTHAELESLVYTFSHDLKSPLISLLGYMDYLRSDYGSKLDETGMHYLERMGQSAVYMTELIQDLLELSRIGRTETDAEDIALAPLLRDVAEAMHTAHPHVVVDVGPLPSLHANSLRIRQLFTNLIENAAKHGGRADLRITVEAELSETGDQVIVVADDGQGIPAEYRERVFGIFERLEPAEATTGTGMGLAICRKIVEQLHGRIVIADSARGAAFRIELPRASVRPAPLPIPLEVS